jgi:RNA polymerase sigma-70 factor, ECF subfamily
VGTTMGVASTQSIDLEFCNNESREMDSVLLSHLHSFRRRAYQYLGNEADAEDAVQDALLSAYKHRNQFKGQARLSTWLTAIVINSARMQLRKRPRQVHIPLDEPWGNLEEGPALSETLAACRPNPEDECRASEITEHIKLSAELLSPPLRTTFRLRDLDGLSIRETARILGVPNGTVKAQLARARARLRQLLQKRFDGRNRPALRSRGFQRSKNKNKEAMELQVSGR